MKDLNYKVAVNNEQEDHFYTYLLMIKNSMGKIEGHYIQCEAKGHKVDPESNEFILLGIQPFGTYESFEECPKNWTALDCDWADYVLPLVAVNAILWMVDLESSGTGNFYQA
jgi:hypothetical protein